MATRLLSVILVAAAAAIAACGSSPAPKILDTEKVERAIEGSTLAQRRVHTQVSCPSGIHQSEGLTFSCTAVVRSHNTPFVVTQLDGAGHVHYEAH